MFKKNFEIVIEDDNKNKESYINNESFNNFENEVEKNNLKKIPTILFIGSFKILILFKIGDSGVGKSSLLNKLFGENISTVNFGKQTTKNTKIYKNDLIEIIDTKGILILLF
jgi:predicted GTPase